MPAVSDSRVDGVGVRAQTDVLVSNVGAASAHRFQLINKTATASVFIGESNITLGSGFEWASADGPLELELEPGEELFSVASTPQTIFVLPQGRSRMPRSRVQDWAGIINKPATFPPDAHVHTYASLTGQPDLSGLPTLGQKNALSGTSGTPGATNQYVTTQDARNTDARTPTAHSHPQADVTGLTASLSGKAASAHSHVVADTTGLQTALDAKAATSHSHAQADVTGLTAALGAKADTTDARFTDQRVASAYPWIDLLGVAMPLASASGAGTYLGHNAATVGVTAATALSGQLVASFRFDPADYPAITGKTLQFRVIGSLLGNNTAPGAINFTFGLYVVTGTGATTAFTLTLGAQTGSTAVIATPGANPNTRTVGAAFNAPAAATYVLGMVTSGALAANSVVRGSAKLQHRYS